jgi:hypothetical protein
MPMFRLNEPFPWINSVVSVRSLVEELFETLEFIWKCKQKEAACMKPKTDVPNKSVWSEGGEKESYPPVQVMDFL